MALSGGQGGDPAQARRRHVTGTGGEVAETNRGVEAAGRGDEARRRAGVQPVLGGYGEGGLLLPHRDRADLVGSSGSAELGLLAGEPGGCFGDDGLGCRSCGRLHDCGDQAFDQRSCSEVDTLSEIGIEQLERQLAAEHGTPQIHQHDDSVTIVDLLDRCLHRDGICAERTIGDTGGDGHRHGPAGNHFESEVDRGFGQGTTVADDDQTDHHASVATAAVNSIAVEVAPGSWWPMLRSPR